MQSAQSQRSLILNIIIFDRAQFVPENDASGDGYPDADTDQKESATGGQPDGSYRDDYSRDHDGPPCL